MIDDKRDSSDNILANLQGTNYEDGRDNVVPTNDNELVVINLPMKVKNVKEDGEFVKG